HPVGARQCVDQGAELHRVVWLKPEKHMTRIYVSDVIDAPIEKVWGLIRDFNGMPKWHPFIRDSMIEDGLPSDAVGCVRNFHLANGGHLREQLLSLSDRDHECTYCILESPMPVTGYVACYRLLPITEG